MDTGSNRAMIGRHQGRLSAQLLAALDIDEITNPSQVYRELVRVEEAREAHKIEELSSLSSSISSDYRLPSLVGHRESGQVSFECKCPRLSIEEQRDRFLKSLNSTTSGEEKQTEPSDQLEEGEDTVRKLIELPGRTDQLLAFGPPSRNDYARKLRQFRRNEVHEGDGIDVISLKLYKLEELVSDSNANLADKLVQLARESAKRLGQISQCSREQLARMDSKEEQKASKLVHSMIRAPIRYEHERNKAAVAADWRRDGNRATKQAKLGQDSSGSGDSGVGLENEVNVTDYLPTRGRLKPLEELMRFRSNARVVAIAESSIRLFKKLLSESQLFEPTPSSINNNEASTAAGLGCGSGGSSSSSNSGNMLSPQNLKLHVCVECQKLRSSIRFKWITSCLMLAFGDFTNYLSEVLASSDEDSAESGKRSQLLGRWTKREQNWQRGENSLPPIVDSSSLVNQSNGPKCFDLLAYLMAHLLRQHFLLPALQRWCLLLENNQFTGQQSGSDFGLSIASSATMVARVEMLEQTVDGADDDPELPAYKSTTTHLISNNPAEEFKQTMYFVVDELASICRNLPRLETLLESQALGSNKEEAAQCKGFIPVLHEDDELVVDSKRRISQLVERSIPLDLVTRNLDLYRPVGFEQHAAKREMSTNEIGADRQQTNSSNWILPEYSLSLELINRLRRDGQILDSSLIVRLQTYMGFGMEELNFSEKPGEQTNDHYQLGQLKSSCQQIRLLHLLESRLCCDLPRYQDFGFVMLDYSPLVGSLIKCIQRERMLLIRLNLDDLLKLMSRLRLQFDEIELGIDLDSAIEEYLAERWQAKQALQPLILAGDDSNYGDQVDYVNLPEEQMGAQVDGAELEIEQEVATNGSDTEEDELLGALTNGKAGALQLLALGSSKGLSGPGIEAEGNGHKVATLIECRLLVAKFEYLAKFLETDLELLIRELEVVFEGLVFLGEFVDKDQLEPAHTELIVELSARAQEFNLILTESLTRLNLARDRLLKLNELRSKVLSKLVVEFHQLMCDLCRRRLTTCETGRLDIAGDSTRASVEGKHSAEIQTGGSLNIRQLDLIQEASDWAQKLSMRFDFLCKQNSLLVRELHLISKANLKKARGHHLDESESIEHESSSQLRALILDRWRLMASLIARYWRLVEEFETQQVKWLNSDIKRIEFAQIETTFNLFVTRLNSLKLECSEKLTDIDENLRLSLEQNIFALEGRFEEFVANRLPVFRFLTNRHLKEAHWLQLAALLKNGSSESGGAAKATISPQSCTTVAQFLEFNIEMFVAKLEALDKSATVEHELGLFLFAEVSKSQRSSGLSLVTRKTQMLNLDSLLRNWTDQDLVTAAWQFIEMKVNESSVSDGSSAGTNTRDLAESLVAIHSFVKRYLTLKYNIGLENVGSKQPRSVERSRVILRSSGLLTSAQLVGPALFVEYLRLFTQTWLRDQQSLAKRIGRLQGDYKVIVSHLEDIESLFSRVKRLRETDLQAATEDTKRMLVHIERETLKLELEREICSTKEAQALEQQREALRVRDDCIRRITERAIPAIRAAARALDSLDGRSLRTLRSMRPSPPDSVKLVIEAVCLLRSCATDQKPDLHTRGNQLNVQEKPLQPERHFDAVRGKIIEDYWPVANRALNGVHSSKFLQDLRRVDKKKIPNRLMHLIRRKYLCSKEFNLNAIKKVSHECFLLAKWLIAVDVFDRVINIVRPNYKSYQESESKLADLLAEVNSRRRQIELIGNELQQMEDSFGAKISHKMSLVDSLDQCQRQLDQVEGARAELLQKQEAIMVKLGSLQVKQRKLTNKCLLRAAKIVYVEAMRAEDQQVMVKLEAIIRGAVGMKLFFTSEGTCHFS